MSDSVLVVDVVYDEAERCFLGPEGIQTVQNAPLQGQDVQHVMQHMRLEHERRRRLARRLCWKICHSSSVSSLALWADVVMRRRLANGRIARAGVRSIERVGVQRGKPEILEKPYLFLPRLTTSKCLPTIFMTVQSVSIWEQHTRQS